MARIQTLSPHVADLIAAGEVVERPGSVVKELLENAIDAGASVVTVEIKGGGLTYIRVTDNGSGMAAQDAPTAFLRHATSKLQSARDLEAIGTLGFRGEALAAISAVSRIDLLTRETGAAEGTSLSLAAGQVTDHAPAGCPEGTTIIVRDLFYNTPARLKFMKSDKAEGANVTAALLRCALSHPEVSVRYIRDGKEEFHTPGDGKAMAAVYTLLGREFAGGLLETRTKDEFLRLNGFVTIPDAGRGNRSWQYFFVNGRYIKSRLLQAALEQAYKNCLFTGRFPGCVLYLELGLNTVDVNVHPTKTEVKFLNEKQVFDGVYYGVLGALEGSQPRPRVSELSARPAAFPSPPGPPQIPVAPGSGLPEKRTEEKTDRAALRPDPACPEVAPSLPVRDDTQAPYQTARDAARPLEARVELAAPLEVFPEAPLVQAQGYRIIGELFATYVLVEQGDRLILIDKHAAHERILFDRLRARDYVAMPQLLLVPVTVRLGMENTALLLENGALLEEYGFEIDAFGGDTIALRQIPSEIAADDMEAFLSELCDKLRLGHALEPAARRDQVLHTVACKAAVKAGESAQPAELAALAERVLSGAVKYCPHGRPVSVEMEKKTIDKRFQRT